MLKLMPGAPESPIPAETSDRLTALDVRDSWLLLSRADRALAFQLLSREHAGDFFLTLPPIDQAELLAGMPAAEKRTWIRALPPHDAAHVIRAAGDRLGRMLLSLLDEPTRHEILGLLAHAEDSAGGLMDPRYARLRAEITVEEALWYLRQQLRERRHTLTYAYVLDEGQHLVGVVPHWQLLVENEEAAVSDIMKKDVISIREDLPEAEVARKFQ
jgi:magnesium transporter